MKEMLLLSFILNFISPACIITHKNTTTSPSLNNEMIILRGPSAFLMGSPETEKYRTADEIQHQVTIPRSFAISKFEVTVAQFQKFLEENPIVKLNAAQDSSKNSSIENKKLLRFSPDLQCPQILVTWYEAAQYCNWLSKIEGIPESEWVYPKIEDIKSGMKLSKTYLNKKGYRLPTEAEWEYSDRAGTTASRYFGDSDEELSQYAWYSKNPPQKKGYPIDPGDSIRTYPVGLLKPNQYGLFDMYGNVWEWCDSRRLDYIVGASIDQANEDFVINDSTVLVRRGGSFAYSKEEMRSAHRGANGYLPNQRRDNVGFRIVKTID